MYAVIRDGSRQYRVEEGGVVDVELRTNQPGETIEFPEVLLVGGDGDPRVGTPTIPGAKVVAEVKAVVKGKKLEILYWRRRKAMRSHRGHRQRYTRVAITRIVV